MNETPQQYTQRILGYVEGKEPLEVQASTPGKLERLIKGLSMTKLRERPAADKWSVSEIVAHLADAEIVTGFRMRLILGAPGAPIAAASLRVANGIVAFPRQVFASLSPLWLSIKSQRKGSTFLPFLEHALSDISKVRLLFYVGADVGRGV
jgi:hypothetical protein